MFHEAGHPIFGLFGNTLGLYGGTLGQLAFPLVTSITFWRSRETAAFFVCQLWLFENFLNIARYMADARTQVLPLLGAGEHDWTNIFSRWGLLWADQAIAGLVKTAACLGIGLLWLWLASQWRKTERSG